MWSNVECLERCRKTLRCVSVNWNEETSICQLNDAEIDDVPESDKQQILGHKYYWLDVGGCKCY